MRRSIGATSRALWGFGALAWTVSCGSAARAPVATPEAASVLVTTSGNSIGRVDVRTFAARPRITLVSREGDPVTAVVAVVATDDGPVAATVLSALLEGRLRAAGYDADARADRGSAILRWTGVDAARLPALMAALAAAFHAPVTSGAPELALVSKRLASLKRNPIEPELTAIAACTGRLGVPSTEAMPDPAAVSGVQQIEAYRQASLTVGRASIAAVGPAAYCVAAAGALEGSSGWDPGPASRDPAPIEDRTDVYAPASMSAAARVTVAVRVGDATGAVAAAARLGAPDSPLIARLGALPHPFRATDVVGVARPRGGCVSVTIETANHADSMPVESSAARAAALVRQEIGIELAAKPDATIGTRQILAAGDPREAGARAAWWALAGTVTDLHERTATALAVPAASRPGGSPKIEDIRMAFPIELARASAERPSNLERAAAIERGQGELWALLASPCGVSEEGTDDAGATALAAIAAVASGRREGDVALEPWVTADGVGVLAHAAAKGGETPAELASRVAGAAARAVTATTISTEAVADARALSLEHLERQHGRAAAALEAFTGAIAPGHPSWIEPFGVWSRVVGGGVEAVRFRWQALGSGPLRLAILANADASQVGAAEGAVTRWLPNGAVRSCPSKSPIAGRTGRFEVTLARDAGTGQAVIGAPVPPLGSSGWGMAELTTLALDGRDGLLARTFESAQIAAHGRVALEGGSRAAALFVDVQAPPDVLESATGEVKSLLARLGQAGPSDADLTRAASAGVARMREARLDPRRRLIDLWSGRTPPDPTRPSLGAWRDWIAATFREGSLVIIAAKPEQ